MTLWELEASLERRLRYAKSITATAITYTFVRHNMWFNCDFAGYLLAYVSECPGLNGGEFMVCVKDADDYSWSMFFKTKEAAEKAFDKFFGEGNTGYTVELERELHHYGFY